MLRRFVAFLSYHLILLACLAVLSSSIHARKYGFLVGVSKYPNLPEKYQLNGPDNDVKLMLSVLRHLKVEERDITRLYSSNEHRPTRSNIISGLRELARKTGKDDFVYLYFAGHGSRQPARADDVDEDDGLDEIFLPQDVGSWNNDIGTVERAITDNEIHDLIADIRANGTFVWAIFDSCHSGTMLRSLSRIKWRKVSSSALGIPTQQKLSGRALARKAVRAPKRATRSLLSQKTGKPGGYVAFYAAQSHELAPELALPANAEKPLSHGLFTYQLAKAMMSGNGQTYRQLGQQILQNYVKEGMRATTPLFEGTRLDAPMFETVNQAAGTRSAAQWLVRLRGGRHKKLYVPAGQLQQIGKGAIFALLANVSDKSEQAIGYAKATHVELFGTQLLPVAFGGKNEFDLKTLPKSAYARIIRPSFQFALTVAMPRRKEAQTARERRVAKIIAGLASDQAVSKGASGLQVKWVEAGTPADINLVYSPPLSLYEKFKGLFNPAKGCKRNRLWFVDRTGALICAGSRANLSFQLQKPSADFDENVKKALRQWLNAMGKVRNLEQMAGRFKGGRFARKVKIRMLVKRAGQTKEIELDQSSRQPLHEGDRIRLEIVNGSRAAVDLTILFVDSRFGITTLFPTRGRTNRIAAGSRIDNIGGKITRDTVGLEGMIVIASKAGSGTPVADFSFLSQKKLSRRKAVRSMNRSSQKRRSGQGASQVEGSMENLFARAAFGRSARNTRSVGGRKGSTRTPYKSVTIKSLRWLVAGE
ncbi:MAG: caspase family protein [Hyphomicrobiaceae bacterium]|nr:caspase family protein [Hyphomicrobiaceae bacterium]